MRNLSIYIIMIIYLVIYTFLSSIIPNIITYLNPLILLIIGLYIYFICKDNYGRFPKNKDYIKKMIIIMLIYTIIYFLLGFILGYVKSPYSHKLWTILKNCYRIILPIISVEYIRSYTLCSNEKSAFTIITFTLVLLALELNINTFINNLNISESAFEYISQTCIPLLASSILCTYLCIKGSYKLSLSYRLIPEFIIILSPIYPDLDWFAQGIIGILLPAIIFLLYKYDYLKANRRVSKRKVKKQNPIIYVPIFIILILFGAFMLGVFSYSPIAMLSNSMDPVYNRGDVLVLRKVNSFELKKLKKYDIIIYSIDKQQVAHRIINIKEEHGKLYFKTKGDANISADLKWVSEDQIIGKYVFHIKYIGYPSVWLNDLFKKEKAKVEIK